MKKCTPLLYLILFFVTLPFIGLFAQQSYHVEISKESYKMIDKKTGKNVFTSAYNFLDFYGSTPLFIAKKGEQYGLIDEKEMVILPFEYDTIVFKRLRNDRINVNIPYGYVQQNNRYGLLDSMGNLTTPIHFEQRLRANNQWGISCSVNGKYGGVSLYGELLVPFEYDKFIRFNSEGIVIVKKNEQFGVYKLGASLILPTEFKSIIPQFKNKLFIVKKDEKKGIYNSAGELLLPITYDDISFSSSHDGPSWLLIKKDNKQGLVDNKGAVVIPLEYESINTRHPEGFIVQKNGKVGVIGHDGTLLVPLKYKNLDFHHNSRFNAKLESRRTDNRAYIIREDGTHFDTTAFDDYQKFYAKYILLKAGNKLRMADWYGNIKPGAYDKIDCPYNTRHCFASNDGNYGVIDYQGNVIIPLQYNWISHLGFDRKYMSFVDKNDQVGVMNIDGLVILPAQYQKVKYNENALKDRIYFKHLAFNAKHDDKWGLVTSKGEWLIPPEYDQLFYFNNGLAPAQKEGRWGVINLKNEVVTTFRYEHIRLSSEGIDEALIEDKWIKVDKKGIPLKDQSKQRTKK